ncbi:MAG: Ig-like domain-containing protein, partial [Gemmatimonadaceae bacterium]
MRRVFVLLAAVATACSDGGGGPPAVASVTVAASPSTNLTVGQTAQLSATPKDRAGNPLQRPVTYRSANDAIVSVSPGGLVTAMGVGESEVIATSEAKDGKVLFT